MAIVTRFSRVTKDRVGRPKNTECGFCPVEIDGTTFCWSHTAQLIARCRAKSAKACIWIDTVPAS